jgi:IMP and pyridine-specific 5'-nucleotidase
MPNIHTPYAAPLMVVEWIKGLLMPTFVLHSQPTGVFEPRQGGVERMVEQAHRRYYEIMRDVEDLIDDHSEYT